MSSTANRQPPLAVVTTTGDQRRALNRASGLEQNVGPSAERRAFKWWSGGTSGLQVVVWQNVGPSDGGPAERRAFRWWSGRTSGLQVVVRQNIRPPGGGPTGRRAFRWWFGKTSGLLVVVRQNVGPSGGGPAVVRHNSGGGVSLAEEEELLCEDVQIEHPRLALVLEGEQSLLVVLVPVVEVVVLRNVGPSGGGLAERRAFRWWSSRTSGLQVMVRQNVGLTGGGPAECRAFRWWSGRTSGLQVVVRQDVGPSGGGPAGRRAFWWWSGRTSGLQVVVRRWFGRTPAVVRQNSDGGSTELRRWSRRSKGARARPFGNPNCGLNVRPVLQVLDLDSFGLGLSRLWCR
ncbi:hypothetical protein M5K25_020641 [Dendrobium thyrsiflorum]|uniref:Uncharacterized protein n=1 Tax=Dendrobium thyrsiflorum TaxID=117978 RepID=A0ABD0UAH9_DENTH